MFFRKEKDNKGVRIYLLGVKIFEKVRKKDTKRTYLFGIRFQKKKMNSGSINERLEKQLRLFASEQKILSLGQYYKNLSKEERYVLCMDCLTDPYAEAIDAWTFFLFLRSKGIPSKYVLLRKNALFKKLKDKNQLDDILPVDNELQLLTDYPEIIAKSRFVLGSFVFALSPIFKQLPFLSAVFIEHGVPLFREWTRDYNGLNGCCMKYNGMLVPTVLTKVFYDRTGYDYQSLATFCCGFPRWDRLERHTKNKKSRSIFVFFTYRTYLNKDKKAKAEYLRRIRSFVEDARRLVESHENVKLFLSVHHNLLMSDPNLNCEEMFKGVNMVPTTEISNMIKEADMCITDFSSLAFDFMYRDVPVVYYCFDADVVPPDGLDSPREYANKIDQYLYNCCRTKASAIAKVRDYIERDFEIELELIEKNKAIFWSRQDNCERLWQMLNETYCND